MALQIMPHDIVRAEEKTQRLERQVLHLRKKAEEVIEVAVRSLEVSGAAFAIGVLDGRYDGFEIGGMPGDLLAAGALHGVAFMGWGGQWSSHCHAFGDGALGSYSYKLGRGIGVGWKIESKGGKAPGASLSDADLARVAAGG